jgi:hypothetical protein
MSKRFPLTMALLAALSGCAHLPPTRACLTQQQYQQMKDSEPPRVHDKLTGKADEDIRPIAGSNLKLRSWGESLLDLLSICAS